MIKEFIYALKCKRRRKFSNQLVNLKMAFVTDVREFQALLDACSSTKEWQMLMDSVLIPDEWMAMAYARLTKLLNVKELEVS